MKTLLTFCLAFALIISAEAQKRTVNVGDFSELSLGIPGNLYLKQGNTTSVEIECDDDDFEDIEFKMNGDRLSITKEGKWSWKDGWNNSDVTIYVIMREIEELTVSGSGNIQGKGSLDVENIDLAVSGSGDIELDLSGSELEARISGSGSISLSGSAKAATAIISGSGKVKAEDMTVSSFEARISGSGNCYITATDEIEASISGSGSVYYDGNPDRVISNSSGSGKVKRM